MPHRKGGKIGRESIEVGRRQMIDAGGPRAAAAAVATAERVGARRRGERRPHADRVAAAALRHEHRMGALRLGVGELVGGAAEDAPAPRRIGQHVHARARILPARRPRQRARQIVPAHGVDGLGDAFVPQQLQRVAIAHEDAVQLRRGDVHVGLVLAVGVVVDRLAEPAQARAVVAADPGAHGEAVGHAGQVVAVRAHQRPAAVRPAQRAIDEQAGADVAGAVDVRLEQGVLRDVVRGVVIEVPHPHAGIEQAQQGGTVALQRQVEDVHRVAGARLDPLEQLDLALQPGDQQRRRRLPVQLPLHGGTQPVGVAVADVDVPGGRAVAGRSSVSASRRHGCRAAPARRAARN